MGVTHGKKSEHHLQISPTRSRTPLKGTASAHAGLLSEQDGAQGQRAKDQEQGKSGGSPPQPESQEEEGRDFIIQTKKRLNLVSVSKSHQELHRELRMTHKRGPCLEVKPELQRVLEQRNWEQGLKQRREAEEEKKNRSPLQQELLKRHQRLGELERELKAQQEGLQSSPEFVRVKESLRRTTILDVGEKVV
ncbi:actin-associated protein FAM107A-like [Salvelinus fontinalis]|uniref:actin-associated protein FAM107A-like n=1 Tax=Salvelinus fontinalis TaxID=8038 RepID=UPI0024869942|nr:actin-associated protein FAM107A-like [Salvelinus fontinalis]